MCDKRPVYHFKRVCGRVWGIQDNPSRRRVCESGRGGFEDGLQVTACQLSRNQARSLISCFCAFAVTESLGVAAGHLVTALSSSMAAIAVVQYVLCK